MKATQPIRKKRQVKQYLSYFRDQGQIRNHTLAILCVYTALRIGDILGLTFGDVYGKKGKPRKSITITEKKTGKTKTIALHKKVVKALKRYHKEAVPGLPLILNKRTGKAISRVHAHRILRAASEALGFEQSVSCHSLRKTFGYHAWKNGVSPAVIMEIYNHSSLAVTRRYLGVCQDDLDAVYLEMKFAE